MSRLFILYYKRLQLIQRRMYDTVARMVLYISRKCGTCFFVFKIVSASCKIEVFIQGRNQTVGVDNDDKYVFVFSVFFFVQWVFAVVVIEKRKHGTVFGIGVEVYGIVRISFVCMNTTQKKHKQIYESNVIFSLTLVHNPNLMLQRYKKEFNKSQNRI